MKINFRPKPKKYFIMKKFVIIKYGAYSAAFLIVFGIITFLIMGGATSGPQDYAKWEVIGYLTILLSLVFVYLGIKKYRDEENEGEISFGRALKIGALIVLFPAIAFSIYNIIYVEVLDPEFADKYYEYQLEKMKSESEPSEYATIEASLADQREMWGNIPLQSVLMFMTVYVIGFIISLLSSFILSRGKPSSGQVSAPSA